MEIHWIDVHCLSAAEREAVEERLRRLAQGHDDLLTVRLAVETNLHHAHGHKQARIASFVRGIPIAIHREQPELEVAIEEALNSFESEVQRVRQQATMLR